MPGTILGAENVMANKWAKQREKKQQIDEISHFNK